MAKTTTLHMRIEPEVKNNAEIIFKKLGIRTADAINLFLNLVILNEGLPFDVKLPNKLTLKTMRDAEKGVNLHEFENADDMFKELGI
jgi:DNA-damage-inducible protein J